MERPPEINKSILEGNKKHLSNAGRKGAELTHQIKELKKIQFEEDIEKLEKEMEETRIARGDDPVD